MVKKPRQKYSHRFNFALTEQMHLDIHRIAELAEREDAAEVVRRMITRETPFFLHFASVYKRLPNLEERSATMHGPFDDPPLPWPVPGDDNPPND